MQNLVFTQLSIPEVRQLFREELAGFFAENQQTSQQPDSDEIGGVELAVRVTGYKTSTIYDLVHKRQIPHSKRGKKLVFAANELFAWMQENTRKTTTQIEGEASAR